MKSTNHILDTALKISDQAAELIRLSSQKIKSFKSKGEVSNLVTQTDVEVDKLITKKIKESFPEHNIVSEELGSNNLNSDYTWYIDPIDGTNNFVHNYPSYAVSIGVFFKSKPLVGVVYDIPNNEKFFASKDGGSFSGDSPISVSDRDHFNEGLYVTGFIPYDENYIDKNLQIIKNINESFNYESNETQKTDVVEESFDLNISEIEKQKRIKSLRKDMEKAAKELNFIIKLNFK